MAAGTDRALLMGAVKRAGDAARAATYEHAWEGDAATWKAVIEVLESGAVGTERAERAPDWLEPLVRNQLRRLATRTSWSDGMKPIRLVEEAGLVELDADDDYVLAVVGSFALHTHLSRVEAFLADRPLLDKVVWRMFEVEGGGEVSLANSDKYRGRSMSWQDTFLALVESGTLARADVLDASLAALARDFSAYRVGWYAALFTALVPTDDELAARQPALRDLLRSQVTATVTICVKLLRRLRKAGLLDAQAAVSGLGPAVLCPIKGTAVEAIRLLTEVRSEADVAVTAALGLEHPNADVQAAAAKLLTQVGQVAVVDAVAEHLSPSVPGAKVQARREEAAVELAAPTMPPPATENDVVDRLAALLEDASNPVELELVLAAVAELSDLSALRPLLKRARSVLKRGPREGVTGAWLRGRLAALVLAGSGEKVPPARFGTAHVDFLIRRLELAAKPGHWVAAPESPAGWISPATLVERLQTSIAAPVTIDLVAALLRLHPDGRADALGSLQERGSLTGELAAVVRYALGAEPPAAERRRLVRVKPITTPSLWVAASRTRSAMESDVWLSSQGITGAGRSEPIDVGLPFGSKSYTWKDTKGEHTSSYATWELAVRDLCSDKADEPTGVSSQAIAPPRFYAEDYIGWAALTWPHDAEHFLITGLNSVLRAAWGTEIEHDAARTLAALARHEGRLGQLAYTALAAGASAKLPHERVLAADAILALSERGALLAAELATAMTNMLPLATLSRWTSTFTEVARSGPQRAELVIEVLNCALPGVPRDTAAINGLLELLRDEQLRADRATTDGLRPWLEGFSGSSRAAKAARALLTP